MFGKILMVCTGNLCRSPMAEAWLRHRLGTRAVSVSSAGIAAVVGAPADAAAVSILSSHGVDLSPHRARQVRSGDVVAADLILVMERWQKAELERLSPAARGRTYLLAHWDGLEIADPHGGSAAVFEETFHRISRATETWLTRIN